MHETSPGSSMGSEKLGLAVFCPWESYAAGFVYDSTDKEEIEMKTTTRIGLVLILVGLVVVLSFPGLTGADGGGANVVRGEDCTISLAEVGGCDVTTTETQSVETPSGNVSLVCRADLPDGLEPPRRAVRTRGELCETPLGPTTDTEKVITPKGKVRLTCRVNGKPLPTTGWAICADATGTPHIVHTADGGLTWQVQGDLTGWQGCADSDISAVDDRTAWASLTCGADTGGAIVHTTDGGATWVSQSIPSGLESGMKSIKGLSRREAWAASLGGTILHTTDGGATWNVVPHPTVPIYQVNRMDAISDNVWIADCLVDGQYNPVGVMVRTRDGGATWTAEHLPGDSPLTVHAFSPEAVWASGSSLGMNPAFYRTLNGGASWDHVLTVGGNDHLDDICAAGPDDVWGVTNQRTIWRIHVAADGTPEPLEVTPPELGSYMPEGITCLDARVAWVVAKGLPGITDDLGVILHTTDGGKTWVKQSAPADVGCWKVSFAGARR
jgi:photosystem II stability/assembly factor-like uncharacterized protein